MKAFTKIAIVGCVSRKLIIAAKVREIYASALFKKSLAHAETFAGETRYEVDVVDGAAPDGDTLDEIAYDLNSNRRRYQGKVVDPTALAFGRVAAVVAKLEADREPQGFRPGAIDALGLGVCAKCQDLACDCACSKARVGGVL